MIEKHEIRTNLNPMQLYKRLRRRYSNLVLLESMSGPKKMARQSFIGFKPKLMLEVNDGILKIDGERVARGLQEILSKLRYLLKKYSDANSKPLVHDPQEGSITADLFTSGLVGFFSYDFIRYLERVPNLNEDDKRFPDAVLALFLDGILFDHVNGSVYYFHHPKAPNRLSLIESLLTDDAHISHDEKGSFMTKNVHFETTKEKFEQAVQEAKQAIEQGEVFQVVLSQRACFTAEGDRIILYEKLREINPSPYMFCLELGDIAIIGASPELLVAVQEGKVITYPIAGTRPKGRTEEEKQKFTKELLQDEKERAEHNMLVDLARNDLGRVCTLGSVTVSEFMKVEEFSHVLHLVSKVEGTLAENKDALDAFMSVFPAGTVTGAPKIRAMEIIEQLERMRRGPYAGAVGYFDFHGNAMLAITIRSIFGKDAQFFVQAGAGIVMDSHPELEFNETMFKLAATLEAISLKKPEEVAHGQDRILILIDNYDSFTYNLYQLLGQLYDGKVMVFRNDEVTVDEIKDLNPTHIVFSPGPGHPEISRDFGVCRDILKHLSPTVPTLGVCLGHQGIGAFFGARIVQSRKILHGKTSTVTHDGKDIFKGVPNPITVARYHSLVIDPNSLPQDLKVLAKSEDGEIMAIRHAQHHIFGIQFHPESFLTEGGVQILQNFLSLQKRSYKELLEYLIAGNTLSVMEAREVMNAIMSGEYTSVQAAGLLTALRIRKETAEEIAGFSTAMQENAIAISCTRKEPLVDVCGTGGATFKTFNVSTVTALVLPVLGVSVAKHGNRSYSSKCGSADLLEALGVNIEMSPQVAERCLNEIGVTFLFAPLYHPAMKQVVPVRRELGIRTIFNLLGPLTNPARVKRQLMGVFSPEYLEPIAQALKHRGHEAALIVHNELGADEILPIGKTTGFELSNGEIKRLELTPQSFGLEDTNGIKPQDLTNLDPKAAAVKTVRLLMGKEPQLQEFVAVNVASALRVTGIEQNLRVGREMALSVIESGKVLDVLRNLITLSGGNETVLDQLINDA